MQTLIQLAGNDPGYQLFENELFKTRNYKSVGKY